ncbi:hypothetical protein GCG54_00007269 [Colletotrichum gloeosporioides]|uniref:Alcohol acetyltransferase n=1 Tax=Colletotrichum gloeosporioides TaxID=474922 RepID=A0A8H4CN64_COLGL|nr:uncharacterized protein GCG54_00007269 [Colletotrichum gloeosporioides]KAF3807015.1 hypothetical protein GCG54_00007269 [Colletotrichum gloeosporioides]
MATTTLTAKEGQDAAVQPSPYTIVRKTTQVDRMFYVYHRLGIQANVLVAARYASAKTGQNLDLSDETVFAALHAVVTKCPELGLVGVKEMNEDGKHFLSLASLNTINLDSCVEFIDHNVPPLGSDLFEKLHSEWLWADGEVRPGQPWWKVLILGRRDVVFLFHHLVCDGSFGMTFHREFLASLNAAAVSGMRQQAPREVHLNPERMRLNERVKNTIRKKPSALGVIYSFLSFAFLRYFYSKALFFTDFAPPRKFLKDSLGNPLPQDRTSTQVYNYRIPAQKMESILAACRSHGTTFTPLLMVLVTGTLAADHYRKAKVGFTRYAVDMRPVCDFEDLAAGQGKMLNLAASVPEKERLGKYRKVLPTMFSGDGIQQSRAYLDTKETWKLVRDYGKRMQKFRKGGTNSKLCKSWLSGNTMGPTLEEFVNKSLPSMNVVMQNSFSVSNLGALKATTVSAGGEEPAVRIEDVQFSTASPHGAVGYHGIVFNVAGMAGGDTVINACTEAGMAPDGLVRSVLDGVMARIDTLLLEQNTSSEKERKARSQV